jgi:hypothetical protein
MWCRYMEEPHDAVAGHETAWIRGLAAEIARLAWRMRLARDSVDTRRLIIGLFPHYPTHAFYRFDSRLYVFHYPNLTRGFHAPAFVFANPTAGPHQFLLRCMQAVVDASEPLDDGVAGNVSERYQRGDLSDEAVSKSTIRVVQARPRRGGRKQLG